MDLSQLSDQELLALHQQIATQAIHQNESSGAPDSSTITNPTSGAQGSMQVMPATAQSPGFGVKPSNGTPEDTAREGRDYYAAMNKKFGDDTLAAGAYNWGPGNMDQWLKNGADLSKLPDETLKYMHNFNQQMGKTGTSPQPVSAKVDSPLSQLSDTDLKNLYAKMQTGHSVQDFFNQAKTGLDKSVNAVQGVGETAASMMTGGIDMGAGALAGASQLLQGNGLDAAKQAYNTQQNVATYQPRTPEGQQYSQKAGEMFGKFQGTMEQGAQNVLGAIPFVGQDLAKNKTAQDYTKLAADIVSNVAPMAIGGEGLREPVKGSGPGVKMPGAASELDKMDRLEPTMSQVTPTTPISEQMPLAPDAFAQADRGSDQVRANNADQAEADLQPTVQDNLQGLRDQAQGEQEGILRDSQMAEERETGQQNLFSDSMAGRVADFNDRVQQGHEFTQGDLFNDIDQRQFDQFGKNPDPRALNKDEFNQTLENLASQEGTRFQLPEDRDAAYSKYLDTVSDKQGGLFDRPTIAENFAKSLRDQMIEDKVNSHPVIKRLQAQVDQLQSMAAGDPNFKKENVTEAQYKLDKAKENIGKYIKGAFDGVARHPFDDPNGVVELNMGLKPPQWMIDGIGRMLKAFHGIVFKSMNKVLSNKKNLNSFGSIVSQGIKDRVNAEANRKWDTQVNEKPKAVLEGVPGLREGLKDYLPFEAREDLSPADLKSNMQQAPDLSEGSLKNFVRTQFLTGQQLAAFSKHPLVKFAVESVDRAMRDSSKFVREDLLGKDGLRNKARNLSDDEFGGIWTLMQKNEGLREFSPGELKHAGYSDKQIDLYTKFRELQKQKLDNLNRGRATAGLRPVEAREAYIAGHFMGDFKRIIKDGEGNVVAVIAHNLRKGVDVISKRVMDQLGEGYTASPIEMRKAGEGMANERYLGYMNILNDMAGRDEIIQKVADAYQHYQTQDAQTAMKYRSAFKSKEGVIGAEGRKSWQDAVTNAREGMKNELRSQEAMSQWANMQEALEKISTYQADPEINAPVAKAVTQRYLDDVQRRNQGPLSSGINSMVNGVGQVTGVGPTALKHLSNITKTNLLTMFIGLGKLSHSFVTLIQPLQGIPVVNSLMRAEGSKLGLSQLSAVAKSFGSQMKLSEALATGKDPVGFEQRAMDFAKANDTLNTRQFQFGDLTDINRNRVGATLHKIAEFNVTGMETATRSFTYMYYAHMLRDLGLPEKEIFPTAHNAMRDVMVDYNSWERPGVFGKLGFLGDLTAMLTRYKFNQIDQFMRSSKYAANGQFGPMATVFTTAMLAAGVRGVMAYSIANVITQQVTTWAAKNGLMQKPTSLDELLLHMLHGKNQSLSDMVKFGLPSGLGLNLTGSLSHADDIPNDPLGSLVPQSEPIGKYASSLYQFLHDPNTATAKSALYGLAPNSARGVIENKLFTDKNGNYTDPSNYTLHTRRTPNDQLKRDFGFRPLNEARESLTTQVNSESAQMQGSVKTDITTKILRDIDSNNGKVTPALSQKIQQQYVPQYLANNGNPDEIAKAITEHLTMGQHRTAAERAQGIPTGLQGLLNYLRYQNLK